jgi:tight adherence protein B
VIFRRTEKEVMDAASAADTALRLAVLMQAGATPQRAFAHLADAGDTSGVRIRRGIRAGLTDAEAIAAAAPPTGDAAAWRDIAAAWRVAETVGAPLAESLRGIAVALRDAGEAADEVRVALAEPAGTARLMSWLPLVGVGLGIALGFDTVGTLVAHPIGVACLVAGVALIVAARGWTRALVRRAAAPPGVPGLDADLLAIALAGGVSIDRARSAIAAVHAQPEGEETAAVLALSRSAGVPAVELLRAAAALARHRARVDGRLRAARLSSRLLLPLGVCTLPAFLLLGVAPMLLSVMAAAPLSL